ncbi:MAG TPA: hypothetical protein V6D02_11050 [Candidatus Obscuribacterales bacterium]
MRRIHWPPRRDDWGLSYTSTLVWLTAASLAVHGLVLGLPLPSSEPMDAVDEMPLTLERTPTMTVAVLPADRLTSAPPPEPSSESPPAASSATARSPQPQANAAPDPAPPPPTPDPEPEPDPPPPPDPTADTDDPLPGVPIDQGSSNLTETDPPPTLEEQLRDRAAYQYEGGKVLSEGESLGKLNEWLIANAVFPSKLDDPLAVPYGLAETCLDARPSEGIMIVMLAADDSLVQPPEIISSTGYSVLDDQAQAMIAAGEYPFPPRTAIAAYSLVVQVQYPETCP